MTKKEFLRKAEKYGIRVLAADVIRRSGGWSEFLEIARDVNRHGSSGGVPGWTYYKDTVPFGEKFRDDILEMMDEESGGDWVKTMARALEVSEGEAARAVFDPLDDLHDIAMNALAWFALEEVSRLLEA